MSAPDWVAVTELDPGKTIDVSVRMKSPSSPGIYQGQWKIFTRNMMPFGGKHFMCTFINLCLNLLFVQLSCLSHLGTFS